MKTSELIKILQKGGCFKIRSGRNHDIWQSPLTGNSFPVGRHPAKEIPTGTADSILKTAGLK